MANVDASISAFLSWLSEIGVQTSLKMALISTAQGRGVFAVEDFKDDEIVFSIPRTAVLSLGSSIGGINTTSSSETYGEILSPPSWLGLTSLIIAELGQEGSTWAPYLAILPQKLDSLVFWSEAELAELQASTAVQKIGKVSAEEMFSRYIAPLGLKGCSTELFHRVASIIMAYAFDIPERAATTSENSPPSRDDEDYEDSLISDGGEDEKTVLSMIPLADMLNADGDKSNARLCCDHEDLEMRTTKSISKGEEILNDYGQLPRADLLRRYGYVTDSYAKYDVAEVCTESILAAFRTGGSLQLLDLMDPLSEADLEDRLKLAERENVYEESYDLGHPGPDCPSVPDELLAFLYLLLLTEESFNAMLSSQDSLPSRSKLSTELVGRVLAILLESREREYATTAEADEKLLQEGNLSNRTTMAIQVRLGEKNVLRQAIQEAITFTGSNKRMRVAQNPQRETMKQGRAGKRSADEATRPTKKSRLQ